MSEKDMKVITVEELLAEPDHSVREEALDQVDAGEAVLTSSEHSLEAIAAAGLIRATSTEVDLPAAIESDTLTNQ